MNKEEFTALAHAAVQQWNCEPDGDIFFTHSSLLWPVKHVDEKLLLKIAKPDDDEAYAADMLRYYNGHGAVKLIKSSDTVQLLEKLESDPAKLTLQQMVMAGQADAATHIICDVIGQLHAVPPPADPLRNLIPFRQRSDDMRKHVNEGRVKPTERPFFQLAYDLCDELIAETRDTQRPLHGDIHHGNIMNSSRGWLAIDPKGILGPRVYEYANSLCNPDTATEIIAEPAHMERQASLMAERAGLDKKLLLQFAFLHAMQGAAWSLDDPYQRHWLACAKTSAALAGLSVASCE
jgi:streptomycin 6-kinase